MSWTGNSYLFRRELAQGYAWQDLPRAFFEASGFEVEMPALRVRDQLTDAPEHFDSPDLIVGGRFRIEVKSRPFPFTSPEDWPHSRLPAFVDTCKKWDGRPSKPYAYVFVSRPTGSMVATCGLAGAELHWHRFERFDSRRRFTETFYAVDRGRLVTMDRLVEAMRAA